MADDDEAQFAGFVRSHARQLQRAAWLLTGDRGTAEDLVQVLRYFDDLTEQAAADALGCSVGTVKSQNARALRTLRADARLRALLGEGIA